MKQYILSSFVSKLGGGNKAAVVFDDLGISDEQMLHIARKNNFSETAFIDIKNSSTNKFRIRYFTPTEEVDICGHAALASFQILKELGYLKGNTSYHLTKAGELEVLNEDGTILIEMKSPELVMQLPKETIMKMIDINAEAIVANENGMIDVISTGLKDIILEVTDVKALERLVMCKESMISICNQNNLIGMHVVSRETIEEGSDFCTRNFAPAVGIDEESATGTSNASMLYYMIKNSDDFDYDKIYKVEQGYFMNSPSNIFVKADKCTGRIFVGGKALIEKVEDIRV